MIYECPRHFADATTWELLRLWRWAQRGFLPDPGSLLDQSHFVIQAFERIEFEMSQAAKEEGKN